MSKGGIRKIDELLAILDRWDERRERAAQRLAEHPSSCWYFAVIGLHLSGPSFDIEGKIRIQKVVEPHTEMELADALQDKGLTSAIARYSALIRHEIAIDRGITDEDDRLFNLAWSLISAIRIRTLADLLVPAVADHSWSTIAALQSGACRAQLLEDVPGAYRFGATITVSADDLDWVSTHLESVLELLALPHFRLAIDCLTTHHHEASLRMIVASLWAGVEAIFGITSELRFRLSALVAAYLDPPGPARLSRYRTTKRLYDFRSRAVHGDVLDKAALVDHVVEVRSLLSALVCRMIEEKRVPTPEQWEEILLT